MDSKIKGMKKAELLELVGKMALAIKKFEMKGFASTQTSNNANAQQKFKMDTEYRDGMVMPANNDSKETVMSEKHQKLVAWILKKIEVDEYTSARLVFKAVPQGLNVYWDAEFYKDKKNTEMCKKLLARIHKLTNGQKTSSGKLTALWRPGYLQIL